MISSILLASIAPLMISPAHGKKRCAYDSECPPMYECRKHLYSRHKVCAAKHDKFLQSKAPDIIDRVIDDNCERGANNFKRMLHKVARRESNNMWWVPHFHSTDVKGAQRALRRNRRAYADNVFKNDFERWQTVGLFGLNSANFVLKIQDGNPEFDPLWLSMPYYSIKAWYRAAKAAEAKLRSGRLACSQRRTVYWSDVHRAVNGGSLCPRTGKKHDWMKRNAGEMFSRKFILECHGFEADI